MVHITTTSPSPHSFTPTNETLNQCFDEQKQQFTKTDSILQKHFHQPVNYVCLRKRCNQQVILICVIRKTYQWTGICQSSYSHWYSNKEIKIYEFYFLLDCLHAEQMSKQFFSYTFNHVIGDQNHCHLIYDRSIKLWIWTSGLLLSQIQGASSSCGMSGSSGVVLWAVVAEVQVVVAGPSSRVSKSCIYTALVLPPVPLMPSDPKFCGGHNLYPCPPNASSPVSWMEHIYMLHIYICNPLVFKNPGLCKMSYICNSWDNYIISITLQFGTGEFS